MIRAFIYFGLLIASTSFGRSQWYYPMAVGNRWEYWEAFPPPQAYVWTTRIVGDTVPSNGFSYRILRSDGGWMDQFQRRVGLIVYDYDPIFSTERILYDFSRNVGDTVAIYPRPFDTLITTVTFDYYAQVFGRILRLKEFYERSTRTSMYVIRTVIDSMGMLRMTYEPGMGGHAVGAIIDGIQYGYITAIPSDGGGLPTQFVLAQNYPNPFNPNTTIRFSIPKATAVTLTVLDILGREVATLDAVRHGPGVYSATWDAGKNASGVYFYRLVAENFVAVRKMQLVK